MCLQCVLWESSCELVLGFMGNQLYACSGRPQLCAYSMLYEQTVICVQGVIEGENIEYSELNTTRYRESLLTFGSRDHVQTFKIHCSLNVIRSLKSLTQI